METLALTGRPGLHGPFGPYLPQHLHIPPSTCACDPTGERALEALDRALEEAGPDNVSAFFCEAISAAALPASTPSVGFWEGLAERRDRHGFLVCFDEVVTGVGRTGRWFAGRGDGVHAGRHRDREGSRRRLRGDRRGARAASRCSRPSPTGRAGSRSVTRGTARRSSCAVGLAVLDALRSERLDPARPRSADGELRDELEAALADVPIVREVRGHGYLLGVSYVDPRDGESFLPPRAPGRRADRRTPRSSAG